MSRFFFWDGEKWKQISVNIGGAFPKERLRALPTAPEGMELCRISFGFRLFAGRGSGLRCCKGFFQRQRLLLFSMLLFGATARLDFINA